MFEGEYLKGEKKGKEYNEDGELIFEGEYINGKKPGEVKKYDSSNDYLNSAGEYLNGKKMVIGKNIIVIMDWRLKVII